MNNKTYGSRPASRGYVNADGTVSRPKKRSGPPPSNAPQHKARAVYGAPSRPPTPASRPTPPPARRGAGAVSRQNVQMPPRAGQPRAGSRPAATPVQKRPPQGGQRPVQKRNAQPPGRGSGWVYPENSTQGTPSDFERYYRQRRQAELQRERQRREAVRKEVLRQKKLRRKRLAAQIRGVLLRFFIVFLLVCGAAAWGYFSIYYGEPQEKHGAVTYTMGEEDSFEASGATAYYDGVLYIDFTRLATFLDMPMAGSIHYMRFIIPSSQSEDSAGDGTEEYVLFTVGSFTASINGVNMDMAGPCRLVDTAIWVPLS
ncbi:MAG: hypothetical protein KHW59_03515, partial [Clostridiales bacterium]|nr:hypothetical protein [Clostridiales bacterium]